VSRHTQTFRSRASKPSKGFPICVLDGPRFAGPPETYIRSLAPETVHLLDDFLKRGILTAKPSTFRLKRREQTER